MQSCSVPPALKMPGGRTHIAFEENLVLIETIFGENSRAISTLARLLETPYPGEALQWPSGQLRRPFLGSIPSGTLYAAIPLSKNSARKSSRESAARGSIGKSSPTISSKAGLTWTAS